MRPAADAVAPGESPASRHGSRNFQAVEFIEAALERNAGRRPGTLTHGHSVAPESHSVRLRGPRVSLGAAPRRPSLIQRGSAARESPSVRLRGARVSFSAAPRRASLIMTGRRAGRSAGPPGAPPDAPTTPSDRRWPRCGPRLGASHSDRGRAAASGDRRVTACASGRVFVQGCALVRRGRSRMAARHRAPASPNQAQPSAERRDAPEPALG
jgi:hypothetical protein